MTGAPSRRARARAARPADGILHPVVLVALLVLVVNDQLAKAAWPGPVTGIASDVAGLIVAPIALQAAWEVALWGTGRWSGPSGRALAVAITVVGVAFAAVQVWPPATDAYRWGLGALQWPIRTTAAVLAGGRAGSIDPVQATADAGDLLALPALLITWRAGRRRSTPGARPPGG